MINGGRLIGEGLDLSVINTDDSTSFTGFDLSELDAKVKAPEDSEIVRLQRVVEITTQVKQAERFGGINKWFKPGTLYGIEKLPKHAEFFKATNEFKEIYFSSANRSGKTLSAAFAVTCWATGIYPDWWKGKRFKDPVAIWAAGTTNQTTRDVIQKELLGDIGSWGTGMIPKDLIDGTSSKAGVPNAVDILRVKHVSGGISTIGFKAYEQGRKAFEGAKLDVIWMDEMPDPDVYSEAYMRTATTKGLMLVTATPLDGMTPLVFQFYSESSFRPEGQELPSVIKIAREDRLRAIDELKRKGEKVPISIADSRCVVLAGWDDAPWLDEETKVRLLAARPPHLRQATSTGIPGTAGGNIYPVPLDEILIDPFPIPKHYKLLTGLDVGWSNTAAAFGALDEDTDTLYVYAEYLRGQAEPPIHAEALKSKSVWKDAPIVIDPASRGRSQADGKQLIKQYRDLGLRISLANNGVESGIYSVWERLSTGKLKIFKSCRELQREYVTYHRDEKGRIVKDNDHICDSVRYLCATLELARQQPVNGKGSLGVTPGRVSGIRYF